MVVCILLYGIHFLKKRPETQHSLCLVIITQLLKRRIDLLFTGLVLNCFVINDPPWAPVQPMPTILKVNTSFGGGNDYGKLTTEPDKEYFFSKDTWDLSLTENINTALTQDYI